MLAIETMIIVAQIIIVTNQNRKVEISIETLNTCVRLPKERTQRTHNSKR